MNTFVFERSQKNVTDVAGLYYTLSKSHKKRFFLQKFIVKKFESIKQKPWIDFPGQTRMLLNLNSICS